MTPGPADDALIDILLVEDDPGDVLITREALADHKVRNRVTVLPDGRQAIAYLRRLPPWGDVPVPDLVLLDLNLPGADGRAVLEVIRSERATADVVVAVLTASSLDEAMLRGFGLDVEMYVTKPVDFASLDAIVRRVDRFAVRVDRVGPSAER
jgi:DNA-binding response OmpR family regulator